MHCDFAFWVGGTHENADDVPELERLPGAAGIKVFMGSSTGSLLVEDDDGVADILRRTRRRAAFHSEDEALLRERKGLRVEGDPRSHPGLALRRGGARLHAAPRAHRARDRRAHPRAACHHRRGDGASSKDHKDVASVEVTPHHLTLAAPDYYERLGTYSQMNPPVRDEQHRDGVWQGLATASPTSSAPTTRRTRARRRTRPIPTRPPA